MPRTSKKPPSAEEIAEKASRGEDISQFFTNRFTVVRPVENVTVGLTPAMLRKVDERAPRMNMTREAVIKTLLDRALHEEAHNRTRPTTRRHAPPPGQG
jgi:hypothetical protein